MRRLGIGAAIVVAIALMIGLAFKSGDITGASATMIGSTPSPTSTPSATSTSPVATKCSTWPMKSENTVNNRVDADGVPEINLTDTSPEGKKAALAWIDQIDDDPATLRDVAIETFGIKPSSSPLVNDGCATSTAVDYVNKMTLMAKTAKIVPDMAPANGYNTGMHNGRMVAAAQPGITGNRKAIRIELTNGRTFWVMARCGNPVTTDKPRLPPGPTDEKPCKKDCKPDRPVCKLNPSLPPGSPKCLESKKRGQDPVEKGNAGRSGGHNTNPGKGETTKPKPHEKDPHHDKPATEPTKEPRPDPTQPPATGAPAPSSPGTGGSGGGGCVLAPGETGC